MNLDCYYQSYIKGRTSINNLALAIRSHFSSFYQVDYFKDYVPEKFISGILETYDML